MKVAILTLRVDNNYGGNLQRYALCRYLQDLGHDVTVLYFRSEWNDDKTLRKIGKSLEYCLKTILRRPSVPFPYWKYEEPEWENKRKNTFPFFDKNIKHSPLIWSYKTLLDYVSKEQFDAFISGSDQIWRKNFTQRWGIERFFLDFAPADKIKVFYSASFGRTESDYSEEDVKKLAPLFERFNAVSVREDSALELLNKYGWVEPKAVTTVDPTLLLSADTYREIINKSKTTVPSGNLFCYVLDITPDIQKYINTVAVEKNLCPFYASLCGENIMSIEQWLQSFIYSEYVITDSYHGMVFSIIFNKPFHLFNNEFRGNTRFESFMRLIETPINTNNYDWNRINRILCRERQKSKIFIKTAIGG